MRNKVCAQNIESQNIESQNIESQNIESQNVESQNIESQAIENLFSLTLKQNYPIFNDKITLTDSNCVIYHK